MRRRLVKAGMKRVRIAEKICDCGQKREKKREHKSDGV